MCFIIKNSLHCPTCMQGVRLPVQALQPPLEFVNSQWQPARV